MKGLVLGKYKNTFQGDSGEVVQTIVHVAVEDRMPLRDGQLREGYTVKTLRNVPEDVFNSIQGPYPHKAMLDLSGVNVGKSNSYETLAEYAPLEKVGK